MSRRAIIACLVAVVVSACVPLLSAPKPPSFQCRAIPDYGDDSIIVEWDDLIGATAYRVFRAEALEGPFEQLGADLPPDIFTLTDPERVRGVEYFYRVDAVDAVGGIVESTIFQQNVNIVWPNPAGRSLLHNWNETIGAAATDGFHKGCDIQQVGEEQNDLVFPRGGVVARVGWASKDNNHIYIEIKIGSGYRYDSFNHLDGNDVLDIGYDVGDYVRAGQPLCPMADRYFTFFDVDFVDHTHFFVPSDPFTNEVDGQHPLKIFLASTEKDPLENRPGIHDHGLLADGTVLFHRQGAAPGPPYLQSPLGDDRSTLDEDEGDVDIHAEIADVMGLGATQAPSSVAYWIEGRLCDGSPAVIQYAGSPYMLFKWDDALFRGTGVDWRHVVDEHQDLAPYISYGGSDYPTYWNNFKHFILTNTNGMDGDPANVDESQFWNTDAREDGSPSSGPGANFAGKEDAVRAADARFPDGDYTIHVVSTDLVGSTTETIQGVSLSNFLPAVATAGFLSPSSFRFEFSEPMDPSSVESALFFGPSGGAPLPFDLAWSEPEGSLSLLPLDLLEPCTQYEVRLDGSIAADLQGNLLDSSFDHPHHDGVSRGDPGDSIRSLYSVSGVVEVLRLSLDSVAVGTGSLAWEEIPGAESYAVSRGTLETLGGGDYGSCLASGLTATSWEDADLPLPGSGFFYLVQAQNLACGPGSLGADSTGLERINLDPGACYP